MGRFRSFRWRRAQCEFCGVQFRYKHWPSSTPRRFCVQRHANAQLLLNKRKIPRDRELLYRLYWVDELGLHQIGLMFGVNHKSILHVLQELDIPRRSKGRSRHVNRCIELGCLKHVFKIRHAGNGSLYGRRCKKHWDNHRSRLAATERLQPHVQKRLRTAQAKWYYVGLSAPKNEKQEVIHARRMLRAAKRVLADPARTPEAILSEKFALFTTPPGRKETQTNV